MNGVKFQYTDAAILFCIPERGCDLSYLVERYTCFERTAIPSYDMVAGCLGRAAQTGALQLPIDCSYRLTSEWFSRVHRYDQEFSATELAMIEFADELQMQEWPAIGEEFVLSESEFERAAKHTRQFLDRLFAPCLKRDQT